MLRIALISFGLHNIVMSNSEFGLTNKSFINFNSQTPIMKVTKKIEKELIFEIILFCAGIASIAIFFLNNLLLSVLLIIAWAIGIKFWHKKHDIFFFVIGAIIGPIGEIVCIYFGVWQYANPTFLGIPIWLPLAWGLATMVIKRIAETFVKIEMK